MSTPPHKPSMSDTLVISKATMQTLLYEILVQYEVPGHKAEICSETFTLNSLDGVYSHGINRFSKFVASIQNGFVKPINDPVCVRSLGAVEQWDGQSGIGITNALSCTRRAMEMAERSGIGCVALANTNHWMRAGTYARYATSEGFAFIGWTNTIHNTPAWGAIDPRLGNNPLAIGVPFEDNPIVLDMAMSQFSYGALDIYSSKGQTLPVPGGFDENGNLTTDPSEIIKSQRPLTVGYWKGSGLSLLLDMLATILSGGLSVSEISKRPVETNVSQVFIAFYLKSIQHLKNIEEVLQQIVADFKQSAPGKEGMEVRYPGERILRIREENSNNGIPVSKNVWREIMSLRK